MAQQANGSRSNQDEAAEGSYCSLPAVPDRVLDPGIDPGRARAILSFGDKWVNQTTLRYYFFDQDGDGEFVTLPDGIREWRTWKADDVQKNVVRAAFEGWKKLGIGLDFEKVQDRGEAEIRIGFMRGDGSWSYIGRNILRQGANQRTMNFGWNLDNDFGHDTALHEIGHTLGLPHEHQNPNAGIVWDEEEVYRRFAGRPNRWNPDKTYYNVIRKIDPDTVRGSNWDPDSIMHYGFGPGLITDPVRYFDEGLDPEPGLSPRDEAWVRAFYPPVEAEDRAVLQPFQSEPVALFPGEQQDFTIAPTATRSYTIRTFGATDTVMVLFEDVDGELRFVAGDDDSGEDWNASLDVRLIRGREYVLRTRLYHTREQGETAVMMW